MNRYNQILLNEGHIINHMFNNQYGLNKYLSAEEIDVFIKLGAFARDLYVEL